MYVVIKHNEKYNEANKLKVYGLYDTAGSAISAALKSQKEYPSVWKDCSYSVRKLRINSDSKTNWEW